jgi:hypothetical protein
MHAHWYDDDRMGSGHQRQQVGGGDHTTSLGNFVGTPGDEKDVTVPFTTEEIC